MYSIDRLSPAEVPDGLKFRELAVGAHLFGQRIGISIARPSRGDGAVAEIATVTVAPQHSRCGVGTALLGAMERELYGEGYRACQFTMVAGTRLAPAFERLLERRNWSRPTDCALLCRTTHERVSQAPWMKLRLPRDWETFGWCELSEAEQAELVALRDRQAFPSSLDPLRHGERTKESGGSIGARREGQLAGWCLFCAESNHVLTCTDLFMEPAARARGAGIALLAEAIRRTPGASYRFDVAFERREMTAFVRRHMMPYLTVVATAKRSSKRLGEQWPSGS